VHQILVELGRDEMINGVFNLTFSAIFNLVVSKMSLEYVNYEEG